MVPMDLRTMAPAPSWVSMARTLFTTDLVRLDMAGGGDRGMSKQAERIEMRTRMVDTYLYEPGILELTDDIVEHSNAYNVSRSESFQSTFQERWYLLTPCDTVTCGINAA